MNRENLKKKVWKYVSLKTQEKCRKKGLIELALRELKIKTTN